MNWKFEPQDKRSSRPQNSLYITLYLLNRHGQLGHTFAKYRFWQMTALLNISWPIWLFLLFIWMGRGIFLSRSFLIVDNVPICFEASGWTECCISGKSKHGWLMLIISTTNIYFQNGWPKRTGSKWLKFFNNFSLVISTLFLSKHSTLSNL